MAGFAQPTQEDIDNFSSLAPGIPRAEIISRLKVVKDPNGLEAG
jgi:hypothetical protein